MRKKILQIIATVILVIAFTASGIKTVQMQNEYKEIKLSTLTYQLEKENVKEINVDKNKMTIKAELRDGRKVKTSYYDEDYLVLAEKYTVPQSAKGRLKVTVKESVDYYKTLSLLTSIIFYAIIFWMIYTTMDKNQKQDMSKAKGEKSKVSFKDVAGMDEEKKELEEVVDFLKNPEKYRKIGELKIVDGVGDDVKVELFTFGNDRSKVIKNAYPNASITHIVGQLYSFMKRNFFYGFTFKKHLIFAEKIHSQSRIYLTPTECWMKMMFFFIGYMRIFESYLQNSLGKYIILFLYLFLFFYIFASAACRNLTPSS